GAQSIHDLDYLKAGIEGREYFDFYYASDEDRTNQNRTLIADQDHGEHWVFRQKDLRGWWENPHHNRPGGVRSNTSTNWVPKSKPIWFTEFGCPAIDKGTNQPNVFYDPKSSESQVPYFSSGVRDDLIQRRYLRAMLEYWTVEAGNNPVSPVYG
ncbi:baseplate megatron protein TIM-barrel domain-containing protein, partial [Pseudovibrio sp. WM33]|uniref:baseplate megatron protein TIM-barrel domain-containing protein n=1 Tax=Pseudovibrio sp. WM33 TaxID=1735585 RepID=UPI0019D3C199